MSISSAYNNLFLRWAKTRLKIRRKLGMSMRPLRYLICIKQPLFIYILRLLILKLEKVALNLCRVLTRFREPLEMSLWLMLQGILLTLGHFLIKMEYVKVSILVTVELKLKKIPQINSKMMTALRLRRMKTSFTIP